MIDSHVSSPLDQWAICFFGLILTVLRGGFGIAQFRPSASDFHGSLTITNNVLKATTKVTCGVARLLSAATMRLVYIPSLFGTQRIGESNSAACMFENAPKGTLLPFGITAFAGEEGFEPTTYGLVVR